MLHAGSPVTSTLATSTMSTPSTATAPLPPHFHGHSYHHSAYATSSSAGTQAQSDMSLTGSNRMPPAYAAAAAAYQSPSTRNSTSARPASAMNTQPPASSSRTRNKKPPDWHEFYKNGVPQEIIVIDDDSPPPHEAAAPNANGYTANGTPADAAVKRRRVAQPEANGAKVQPTYSAANTPLYGGTGSNTISSDRNTSGITTAPTSLGSHGSVGSVGYIEANAAGQKRKRVTRQDATADKKRKVDAVATDPYSNYVPPPRPAKKAKDVQVPLVRDNPVPGQRVDDDDGHYLVTENTPLTNRYHIVRLLGQGTFGKVVEAVDRTTGQRCAVKIIRSVQKYRDASKIELRVLSTLAMNDKENRNKCIHFRECFDFRSHICIVTDLLGQSVFDFLKANAFVPFPSSQIQNFARQLLTSVAFLHDLNLIHTDLKPENILLVSNAYQTFTYNKNVPSSSHQTQRAPARQRRVLLDTDIRLIDFGSATFDEEYHSSVVSTRHYRAPEIILSLGWSFPCDIWSIGCILVEFFTGDALFQTHDNLEHLAMMEMVVKSKIEAKLVRSVMQKGGQPAKFFKKDYRIDYPTKETTKASRNYVRAMKSLDEIIPVNNNFNRQFLDLLKRIFVYDPNRRITAKEALQHPWFREGLVDDGTEAARIKREREAPRAYSQTLHR